jgi:hypothetical protein
MYLHVHVRSVRIATNFYNSAYRNDATSSNLKNRWQYHFMLKKLTLYVVLLPGFQKGRDIKAS